MTLTRFKGSRRFYRVKIPHDTPRTKYALHGGKYSTIFFHQSKKHETRLKNTDRIYHTDRVSRVLMICKNKVI